MIDNSTTSRKWRTRCLALIMPAAALTLAVWEFGAESRAAQPPSTAALGDESLAGIDRPPEEVSGAAVGRIEGTENFIAVVEGDGRVLVYLCDGTFVNRKNPTAVWFEGAWDGTGPVTLEARGMTLTLESDGARYHGELTTADGKVFQFTAAEPDDETGGLYRSQERIGDEVVDRYSIVLDDGESRGVFVTVNTTCRRVRKTIVLADGTTTTIVVEICG